MKILCGEEVFFEVVDEFSRLREMVREILRETDPGDCAQIQGTHLSHLYWKIALAKLSSRTGSFLFCAYGSFPRSAARRATIRAKFHSNDERSEQKYLVMFELRKIADNFLLYLTSTYSVDP